MSIVIRDKTERSICGNEIAADDAIVGTTHFIGDESDPLWRYSDSAMHRECYEAWEHKEEFTRRYEVCRKEFQRILEKYPSLEAYEKSMRQ